MKSLYHFALFIGSLAIGLTCSMFIGSHYKDIQASLLNSFDTPIVVANEVAQIPMQPEVPVLLPMTTPVMPSQPMIAPAKVEKNSETPVLPQIQQETLPTPLAFIPPSNPIDNGENKPLLYNIYNNALNRSYRPNDLVKFKDYGIKTTSGSGSDEIQARVVMMPDLKQLIDTCENESGQSVYIRSGFRSYHTQTSTFGNYGSRFSAYPGTSEHQLGVAIDIESYTSKVKTFLSKTHPVYKCFMAHAYDYGFIQSYPKGNLYGYGEEPWHWRFVGKSASQSLVAQGKQGEPWNLFGVTAIARTPSVASSYFVASNDGENSETFHEAAQIKQKSDEDITRAEELRKKLNRQKLEDRLEKQERAKDLKRKYQNNS